MKSFKGRPLCPLGDTQSVRMKNGKRTAVAACSTRSAVSRMKADRAGTVFQTAGWLIQQPFFGVDLQPAFI